MLLERATTAFPSLNLSLGKISGSTPVIAGHHSALSTPKSAPISAKSQTDGKFPINESALVAAKKLPMMSAPPTTRLRLYRSPTTPPMSISATIGKKRAAITKLRSLPSAPGILKTPYANATGDRPLPKLEINRALTSEIKPLCDRSSFN